MKKRALALLLPLLLTGCADTFAWRQKLTVTVETPAGEVSGASVTEVKKTRTEGAWVLPDARGVRSRVTGEAVVVEVMPGRYVFALLGGGEGWMTDAAHWAYAAYTLDDEHSYDDVLGKLKQQARDRPVPLPPESWPLMVTFADITDPTTVERVDPDDLAASFGPGVRLTSVTYEKTRAPVTEGRVEAVLEWICDHLTDARLSRHRAANGDVTLANNLNPGDFLIGECK